jgi:hypothetical protein
MRRRIAWLSIMVCFAISCCALAKDAEPEGHPKIDPAKGWKKLLAGGDLAAWKTFPRWGVGRGGVLGHQRADIWTADQYGDFILDLEFKVLPASNSGVGIRVPTPPSKKDRCWYRDGALEIQILGPKGHKGSEKGVCCAMYDLVAPSKNMQKKPGQWNRYTITAKGSKIKVIFNGKKVIDMDLDDWTEARKNPDGTPNKYRKAMKDFPRRGHILLQDHGDPVWFRNVYIKKLD